MDFGLAKALDPHPTGDPSQSPTLTAAATQMGVIMGTAAYMSPEARETPIQFTRDPGRDLDPVWMPDGERLLWSNQGNVWSKAADGTGEAEQLTSDADGQGPSALSPDGRTLVFWQVRPGGADVGILSMDDGTTEWLFQNDFYYGHSKISPDGRWIAYTSNEDGQDDIYVRPFPNVDDDRQKISQDGGVLASMGAEQRRAVLSGVSRRRPRIGDGHDDDGSD